MALEIIHSIQNRIYEIRGQKVMLDRDLAALYKTETKALNLAVKRNINRFPSDFMFQLTKEEFNSLRFQIETSNGNIISNRGGVRYLPYAFTEQGIGMLSGVLNSDIAINMHIAIIRTFVEIRRIALHPANSKEELKEIKERLDEHDVQLNHIYDAMEDILDEKAAQRKWDERERIGFKR